MKIKEIVNCIENFAPLKLQESYDNSGLIIGDFGDEVNKALICIDVTEDIIDEAIANNCDLIISHHPLIFGGIKKITKSDLTGKCIIKAIQKNIAIYSAHTNLDNTLDGVNSILGQKIGLINCSILRPQKQILKKLITYCPANHSDMLRNALFEAGAGHIGNYDCCSFNINGTGSFRALENSNPFVGEINNLHFENEVRIETIYPAFIEKKLLAALFLSHPYEEVAYDIYSLENEYKKAGSGLIGELEKELNTKDFLNGLKNILGIKIIRHTQFSDNSIIKRVAICGGAGSFLINDALAKGADIFLTSDLKYHNFFETNHKMVIADIGHYESEQFAKEILIKILNKNFSTFAIQISKVNTNPVCYL